MAERIKDTGLIQDELLIFEQGGKGRKGYSLPRWDVEEAEEKSLISPHLLREELQGLPELSEVEVVRHFTRLSQWNYGVDSGLYPLGSCTMKYNPKVNEVIARMFYQIHPYYPQDSIQGILKLMYELEGFLSEITGMDRVSLQPAAGAHGELTGMLMIKACLQNRGEKRTKVLIPDTAHGTNPSSLAMAGFQMVGIRSNEKGVIGPEQVALQMDEDVAAIMVTNPNTLGLFEEHLKEIAEIVHRKGGFVYCDGANLNALMGIVKLGELGVDLVHINLHKTFSTPHGGGGPGAGPVAIKKELAPFLPIPIIEKDKDGVTYCLNDDRPQSVGKIRAFYGNFGVLVRAYAYILSMGAEGLRKATEMAVLNANYLMKSLKGYYDLPYDRLCMHECVFTDKIQEQYHVSTLDIAKRLIDYGFHPPTIYFPLVVKGALMIEPTESESKEGLDRFIETMITIAEEAKENPDLLRQAPQRVKTRRLDEVLAARKPKLRWKPKE
jgi:glycine dehydrogenase subunit 2